MQLFIVFVILALAASYTLWRIFRTLRGRGDCGCGCGKDCPYNQTKHFNAPCKNCQPRHNDCRSIMLVLALTALTAQAGVYDHAVSRMVSDLRLLPFTELHHVVIIRHGEVVTQWHTPPYRPSDPHNQFSACKMLTGLAVGLAIDDGKLSLDDKIVDILPDKCPTNPSPELRAITVRHLLTMTSGKQVALAIRDTTDDWVAHWLALPGRQPGRQMEYDTMTSFMLSAVVQRVTGRLMLDLLNERILRPMSLTDVQWEQSPDGINTGGWGLRCSTMTMARMGQLLLQHGQWQGRQLIAAEWVREMTDDQLPHLGISPTHTDIYHNGYGYQMWRCGLPGAYRAQGNFGQLTYVYPAGDLVVAVNCTTPNQEDVTRVVERNVPQLCSNHITALRPARDSVSPQRRTWPHDSMRLELSDNHHNIRSINLISQGDNVAIHLTMDDETQQHCLAGNGQWLYNPLSNIVPPYNIGARNRFSGMDHAFTVAANYVCDATGVMTVKLYYVDWYSALTLVIAPNKHQITITDNVTPNHPEVATITNLPSPSQAHAGWWTVAFAALLVALIVLIARNKPHPLAV